MSEHVRGKTSRLKSKGHLQQQAREKKAQKEKAGTPHKTDRPAQLKNNEDGLIEVQVQYNHCVALANGTGFRTAQILNALQEDNEEREAQQKNKAMEQLESEVGGTHIRFSESEDDEDSDLE